jgi:hypothetical protein
METYTLTSGKKVDLTTVEMHLDTHDYPELCDCYIKYVEDTKGNELTDIEYQELHDQSDLVYNLAIKHLF